MKVSVLLPTYNQADYLPRALASLDAQTFRDFELIACDDGSTDATAAILKAAKVRTVTHPRNSGTAAAINSAAALADPESSYMTWVSSDNVMHPRWLERLVKWIDKRADLGAVYSAYNRVEGDKVYAVRPGPYKPGDLIASESCYIGPSFLIRREVWQEHRGGSAHDYDNWLRIEEACERRGIKLDSVPDVLCDYYRGDWNTCKRRPDLYDAPKWQAEAKKRRAAMAGTWLGPLIAARVKQSDEVLDLGCGIMPATGGRLPVKRHVGVDCFKPYVDLIGPPAVCGKLPEATEQFADRSFDVVLLLDVVEHLDRADALATIRAAERIAKREVIVFTPDGYCQQDGWDAWGMGQNEAQAHRCGFTFDELVALGYACSRHPNGTKQAGPIVSVLGVKLCRTPR